jgi:hypothetical protein
MSENGKIKGSMVEIRENPEKQQKNQGYEAFMSYFL